MNCRRTDPLIQQELDGALTADDRAALNAHLADCADCRRARDEFRRLSRRSSVWAASAIREADPGDAFTDSVLAAIAASSPSPSQTGTRSWRFWLALAAAACLVLVVAVAASPWIVVPAARPDALLPSSPAAVVTDAPGGLTAALRSLPADSVRLWDDLGRAVAVPSQTVLATLAATTILLNLIFVARAVRSSSASDSLAR